MTTLRPKAHPHALIPWVLALVAILGCNALASQKVTLRKSAQINGSSATQVADEGGQPTAPDRCQLGLTNGSPDGSTLRAPAAQRIAIAPRSGRIELARRGGAIQGRAPPFGASC